VGITCAKLGEAEVLAEAGFDDVLIANQVVGESKMQRLAEVARKTNIRVAVDHPDQINVISEVASRYGVTVGLLVEVDIGMQRCGTAPGQPALPLAQQILERPGVQFEGLQAYEGHLVFVADPEERRRQVIEAMQGAIDTKQLLERSGIPVGTISGGSSSTYHISGAIDGVTEIQAGTYPTMDCAYRRLSPEFDQALSILTRVISRPQPGTAVLDVGMKGAGQEFGPPEIKDQQGIESTTSLSEEHCVVRNAPDWNIGQTVEIIPSHACTTCNLYREFYVHDGDQVVDVWPIEGSGRMT
jgi:D-serine deaminase-like pyridoxal phosphate-dependent protein